MFDEGLACAGTASRHVSASPAEAWRAGQEPLGLETASSGHSTPVPSLRPATYFLSLGFENTAHPETLAPARGRTRPATSSLECPSRSPRPPPAPEVTHTSPWVHRTLAVHFRGSPRPHVLGFAFEVRGKGAHHTSGRVFLGTGSFLAENKMEEKNSPLPARKPQATGEAAAARGGGLRHAPAGREGA